MSPPAWRQARAHARTAADRIVASLLAEDVLLIEHDEGELCRGDDGSYGWRTFTTVRLAPGTDAELLVMLLERSFRERGDVDVTVRRDEADAWEVRVRSTTDGAGCIVGEGAPGTIWIDSWSPRFDRLAGIRPDADL